MVPWMGASVRVMDIGEQQYSAKSSAGVITMSDVTPINRPPAAQIIMPKAAVRTQPTKSTTVRSGDKAEFSITAKLLGKISELPEIRMDMVKSIQSEIADGTYDTPDKVDSLIDELADDLS